MIHDRYQVRFKTGPHFIRDRAPGRFLQMPIGLLRAHLDWRYLIIGLVGLATHGFMLLMDGVYYDDWLLNTFLVEKNWYNINLWFTDCGIPLFGYFNWWMGYLPDVISGYRVLALVALILCACLVYKIGYESEFLCRTESMFVALLSLTYPVVQNFFQELMLEYLVCYFLFLLGVLVALRSERANGVNRFVGHTGALVLFFIAFNTNSLLVFYFGFLFLLMIYVRWHQGLAVRHLLFQWLPRRMYYVFLPFLFWIIKETFFPRRGLYANYNQFVFSPIQFVINTGQFCLNAVYCQLNNALWLLAQQPVLALFVLLIVYQVCTVFKPDLSRFSNNRMKPSSLILFGIILFGLGIIPYLAVGSALASSGWCTRFALLVGLPMALAIVGVTRLAFSQSETGLSRPGLTFLVALIFAFSLSNLINYISWQARWVKDRSVMVNLDRLDEARPVSVYWVDDQFPLGGEDNYRFYEWSSMFKQVWGDETRIGFNQRYPTPKLLEDVKSAFTAGYNLGDLDPAGCQATLTIRPRGIPRSDFRLAARYFYYKFLHPQGMQDFLAGVTQVQVQPLPSPLAVNCTRQ